MSRSPTTVSIFTADQWAQRLLRVFPGKWTSDQAKMAGGVLYSLFNTQATQYTFLQNGLEWVLDACRIATAEDIALDAIANDYFGNIPQYEAIVVRAPGESDDAFRARIYANLLQSGGTRGDITRVVELLTGKAPRIIEPWNVHDTSACDAVSYCDIDTIENPSRIGDIQTPYQGFVFSVLPSFGDNANNPVWCIDEGLSCDRSFIIDPQPTWFLGEKELDQAINRVRMFSTIVWRQYFSDVNVNYARGNTFYPALNALELSISLNPPCVEPLVVLACASWNSVVCAQVQDEGDFTLEFQIPAPTSGSVDWIAAPATLPGFGNLYLNSGVPDASMSVPIPGHLLLVTPTWDTNVWAESQGSGIGTFTFSVPAPPGGALMYGSFDPDNAGAQNVSAGTPNAAVEFETPFTETYQLFVMPSWNTTFEIVKTLTGFTVTFAQAPPSDGFIYWGTFDQPI